MHEGGGFTLYALDKVPDLSQIDLHLLHLRGKTYAFWQVTCMAHCFGGIEWYFSDFSDDIK